MNTIQDIDEVFIKELSLPTRIVHALSRDGVFTVGKLKKLWQSKKLGQFFSIGPKSLDEISAVLYDLYKNTSERDLYQNASEHIKTEIKLDDFMTLPGLDKVFIAELNLSPRTFHALRHGRVLTIGELKKLWQSKKLNKISNIGEKSLDEISIALNEFCKDNPTLVHDDGLIENHELIENSTDPRQEKPQEDIDLVPINILDLNLSIRRALIRSGVKTIGELRYLTDGMLLNITRIGEKSLVEIQLALASALGEPWKYIEKQATEVIEIEKSHLEFKKVNSSFVEIMQNYFESEKDNYVFIMLSRYGVKPKTLEEIASELGVTRERVRQIQVAAALRFLNYMRLETGATELLGKVSGILSFYGKDLSLKKFREALKKEDILGEFSPSFVSERISKVDPFETLICWLSLLSNSKYSLEPVVFSVDINALINSKNVSINDLEILENISSKIRRKIKRKVLFTGGIYIKDAISILSTDERIATLVLDGLNLKKLEDSWYSLKAYDVGVDGEKIPLRVAGLKILSIASEIDFNVFCDGLRRHINRFYAMLAPLDVLVHILPLLGFEVDNRYKVSTRLSVEGVLSKSENSLISAIAKNESVASFFEIAEEFLLRKLSLPAVSVTLKRSPIVEKTGDGFYKLRGTDVTWQQVDAAQKRRKKFSQDDEIIYGLDGVIRMRLTVNNYAHLTGVVGAYKLRELSGSSWLVMHEKQPFGNAKMDDVYLWGLGKLFKALDVQIGDRLELAFNSWDKTISIRKVENEH